MKNNKLIVSFSFVLLLSSCNLYNQSVSTSEFHKNEFGSAIKVRYGANQVSTGELICVQEDFLMLLDSKNLDEGLIHIPKNDITSYKISYAKPKNYFLLAPVVFLAIVQTQLYFPVAAGTNLVVLSLATLVSFEKLQDDNKDIDFENLMTYSRFPQGLPVGFEEKYKN